jgi:acyl-CoA thioesterase-1
MPNETPPLDPLVAPFWRSTTLLRESVVFVVRETGAAEANLLLPPDVVLRVASADGGIAYREGPDYRIERDTGRLVRPSGSRMPEVSRETLSAADGALTFARTVDVTYTYAPDCGTWHPPSAAGDLPRFTRRLRRQAPVTVCLTGDSISEGYDASGFHGVQPYQPAFGPLVVSALAQHYGVPLRFHNLAAAGWTAADGLCDAERIVAAAPDLVIVAFGMNDACYAEAGEFAANVSGILERVRRDAPEAEFVLVSPMLPTPQCTWVVRARFDGYQAALTALAGDGVLLADVTALWKAITGRKHPHDLSGNGLNHPNDFGHRLYAQVILDAIACAQDDASRRARPSPL